MNQNNQPAWRSNVDTSTAFVPTGSPGTAPGGRAHRGAMPDLGPGWLVLRNCPLGGGGPRIGLALLHPNVGVALVGNAASEADPTERLRRALDARRFPAIFGGYPPIVRASLSRDRSWELDRVVAAAFDAARPLALKGGDAWIGTVRAALEAELPVAAPERLRARRRRARRWRAPAVAGVAATVAAALVVMSWPPMRDRGGIDPAPITASSGAPAADPDLLPLAAASVDDDTAVADLATALPSPDLSVRDEVPNGPAEREAAAGLDARVFAPLPEPNAPAPVADVAAAVDRQEADGAQAEPATRIDDGAAPVTEPLPATPAPSVGATSQAVVEDARAEPSAAPTMPQEPSAPSSAVPDGAASDDVNPAPPLRDTVAETPPEPPAAPASPPGPVAAIDPATQPVPPPKRPPAETPTRTAPQATPQPPASSRRAAPSAAEANDSERCREILVRATMGGPISDGDKAFLRRGCHRRS